MFEDDEIRLRHILDAAREAVDFTEGQCRIDLDADRKLSLSLVRLLEIIGEAARGITIEFRKKYPKSSRLVYISSFFFPEYSGVHGSHCTPILMDA